MSSMKHDSPVPDTTIPGRKSVIVTGGASGIGLAMVRHFASQGHMVAVLDISDDTGVKTIERLADEYPSAQLSFKKCDTSSWLEQRKTFEQVFNEHSGKLDVAMVNAGISEPNPWNLCDLTENEPSEPALEVLNINLLGAMYSVKLAIHYMNRSKVNVPTSSRGSIICTASSAALYPFPMAPVYAASKAGLVGMVRSLARLLDEQKIQINALAPAVLETNITPDKHLFKQMIVTPMETLLHGVTRLISDPTLTGQVAEIHGKQVTFRPPYQYVDENEARNQETFWKLGHA